MTRRTTAADRLATFVVAVALIAVGALLVIWRLDRWLTLPMQLRTGSATQLMGAGWWPFAIAAVGILLAVIGLRWLWAHLSTSGIREVSLPGTGKAGHLTIDVKSAAQAAADALADTPGVRHASGKALRQRRQLVVDLTARVDADAELADIATSADRVSSELAQVLGRPDIYCRVRVGVSARAGARRVN